MRAPKITKLSNFVNSQSGDLFMVGADELRTILTPAICLAALEDAYRHLHSAPEDSGRSLGFMTEHGKFHVKAGLYPGRHNFFAAKVNANFPENQHRFDLPTIQGLIVLCNCEDGCPVAILQSGELTGRRTAAATALAAKHGARADSQTLVMIGCGAQARHQIMAVFDILPIKRLIAVDVDPSNAEDLSYWATETLGIEAEPTSDIGDAVAGCDIAITSTTSTQPIVTPDMVPAGCFIAAVGADNPDKQELDPALFGNARILVDDLEQCAEGGDLAHAIRAGMVSRKDVAATLADLAAGAQPGRRSENEIVIFDSTGTGIQDVAVSFAAYQAIKTASE